MEKAKSLVDKKGASGPFHVGNGQSQMGFHSSQVVVAANGSCCSSNAFGLSSGGSGSCSCTFDSTHHLQRADDKECNGSPAKRCRLRRSRTESVKRNRPRKEN